MNLLPTLELAQEGGDDTGGMEIEGRRVLAGVPYADSPEYNSGAAYVFELVTGGASFASETWVLME